jgi:DNA-binding GntR family transcriptional regulator
VLPIQRSIQRLGPKTSMVDQAFGALHRAIINGELEPGRRLSVQDMASELGTSAMPVREAFRRLEEQGLLETTPHRGAIVRGLTEEELLDVYGVRRLLEDEASRLGAAAITPEAVALMRQEYDDMRAALDENRVDDFLDHDEQLLSIIYSAAGNRVLLDSIRALWNRCRPYKVIGIQRVINSAESSKLLESQEAMIQAATSRDQKAARSACEHALRVSSARIQQILVENQRRTNSGNQAHAVK